MRAFRRRYVALALVLAAPALAAPAGVAPAARMFMVGKTRVIALRDALNVVPNDGKVFGVGVAPGTVGAVLARAQAPTDKIVLGVDALLVRLPARLVLIDTGLGPKAGGALPLSLAAAGVKPEEIADVLITHSHGDHVGGLLQANGGLAFSKAAIRSRHRNGPF